MRPTNMRSRAAQVTAGALAMAVPASAVALAADQADAQSALQLKPVARHLQFGQTIVLAGIDPGPNSGQRLALEFSTARSPWRPIAYAQVHSNGAFRLRAPLTRSGSVRVASVPAPASPARRVAATPAAAPAAHPVAAPAAGSAAPPPAAPAAPVASPPQRVAVAARLIAPTGTIEVLGDQRIALRGALLPERAGRLVRLQGRLHGGWRTLAVARTGGHGRYLLHYAPGTSAARSVRLSFPGDAGNSAVHTGARPVVDLQPALASWYYDAGATACGFHAADGIASPYLPCGTRVTMAYHGRSVTAVVDDRGPFVGGREYDLSQNTAAALGFGGVDTVWSVVQPAPTPAPRHRRPRHRKPATPRHHRPSRPRHSLAARCRTAASSTSTWTCWTV